MNEDIQERIEKPVEGEAKTLEQPEQPLQGNTCNEVEAKNVAKARRAKRVKRSRSSKRKSKLPRLHRPKKESTRTITTRLYKAWSTIVHAQHGNKCAVCGRENSKEAPLNAHHIMPRQMFSGLRFDPQNGVSLCPKCHKLGKFSAHKGGIWFAEWLFETHPDKYRHCMGHMNDELDCKDRSALYAVESDLHGNHGDVIAQLPMYDVVAYDRKGNKVESVVQAYNNRAAEFIFWANWPNTEIPLKGIHKTTEAKSVCPEKVAEMKSDLIRRGLMNEDGKEMNVRQLPKSTDAAAIAVVQEYDKSAGGGTRIDPAGITILPKTTK